MIKMIVHVAIPAIEKEYDMRIPSDILVNELKYLMIKAIYEISDRPYVSSEEEVVCWKEKGIILEDENNLQVYGIQNGDHLLLL